MRSLAGSCELHWQLQEHNEQQRQQQKQKQQCEAWRGVFFQQQAAAVHELRGRCAQGTASAVGSCGQGTPSQQRQQQQMQQQQCEAWRGVVFLAAGSSCPQAATRLLAGSCERRWQLQEHNEQQRQQQKQKQQCVRLACVL
jgi:hypothetical protein